MSTTRRGRIAPALGALAVVGWLALAVPAEAAEQSAARKAGRGAAGVVVGILEIPGNMVKVTRERGAAWGFSLGFVQGIGMTVVRELVGVYELLTCPFEIPAGFQPILEPEFPWGYFEE